MKLLSNVHKISETTVKKKKKITTKNALYGLSVLQILFEMYVHNSNTNHVVC